MVLIHPENSPCCQKSICHAWLFFCLSGSKVVFGETTLEGYLQFRMGQGHISWEDIYLGRGKIETAQLSHNLLVSAVIYNKVLWKGSGDKKDARRSL